MDEDKVRQALQQAKIVTIKDSYGNKVDLTAEEATNAGINLNTMYGNTSNAIYPTNSGGFTNDQYSSDIKTTINLNKDTGKITVMAPEYITERTEYKEQILPQLESLSASYKQNPEAKLASATDDGAEYSIEEWVNRIQDAISDSDYKTQAAEISKLNKKMLDAGFSDWNDAASSIYLYGNSEAMSGEANDYTRVYVSDFGGSNYFKNMESFDTNTGTISYSDFKNWWNRENRSDEEILEDREAILSADLNLPEGAKVSATADAETVARRHALANLIENKTPEMSVWQNIGDNIQIGFMSFADGVAGWAFDIADTLDGSADTLASQYVQGRDKLYEDKVALNKGVAVSNVVGNIAGLFVPLGGVSKSLSAVSKGVKTATIAKTIDNAAKTAETATKLVTLSEKLSAAKSVASMAKIAKEMDKVLDTVSATKTVETLSTALKATSGKNLVNLASSAFKTADNLAKISRNSAAVAKIGNAAINMAQFAVDSVIGSLLIDKDLRDKILRNDVDNTVSEDIMINLAADSLFYGGVKGVMKGATNLGKTTIGSAISLNTARRLIKVDVALTKARNAFKDFVLRSDLESRVKKLEDKGTEGANRKAAALKANQAIFEAKKLVADEDKISWIFNKGGESTKEGVNRLRSGIVSIEKTNTAIDLCQRNITGMMQESIHNSKGNEAAYKNLIKSTRDLTNLEKQYGRKVGKRVKGAENEGIRRMSTETANYIEAKNRMNVLERKGGEIVPSKGYPKNLSKEEGKSYLDAKGQVDTFMKNTEPYPEIREAADNYYAALTCFYKQFIDYYSSKGLFSRTELENLRDTGYWGDARDDYIRTQRVRDNKVRITTKNKKLETKLQQLKSGTGDFVDPTLVATNWMAQVCDMANRQNAARLLFNGGAKSVLVNGTETASTINASHKAQNEFYRDVSAYIDVAMEDISIKIPDLIYRSMSGKSELIKKEKNLEKTYRKGVSTKNKQPASNASERAIYINELSDDKFYDVAIGTVGYGTPTEAINELVDSGMTIEDAFKTWVDSLPLNTKKMIERDIIAQLEAQGYNMPNVYKLDGDSVLTIENFTKMREGDGLFERRIMNSIVSDNSKYRDSEVVKNAISEEKYNYDLYQARLKYAKEKAELDNLQNELGMTPDSGWAEGALYDEVRSSINSVLDSLIDLIYGHNKGKTIQAVLNTAKVDGIESKEFLALQLLRSKKVARKISKIFSDSVDDWAKTGIDGGLPYSSVNRIKNSIKNTGTKILEGEIDSRFNRMNQLMIDTKNPLGDQAYIFENVNELINKIEGYRSADNIIPLGTRNGEVEYVELDPLHASIIKDNSAYEGATSNLFQDTNYVISKIFRLNTTGLRLASWVMQTFRDAIPLYAGVGAMTTITRAMESMDKNFGASFLRYLKEYNIKAYEDAMKEFKQAGKTGEDLNKAMEEYAVQQVNKVGWGYSSSATETTATQYKRREYKAKSDLSIEDSRRGMKRFTDLLDSWMNSEYIMVGNKRIINPLNLNQRREQYMRKLAYTNTLNNALKKGYSLPDAVNHATFMMNNATTNFSRITVHLNTLQKTVPYLGAAINGTKSFYRILELDPVGVLGRLYGGIILPVMALTAYSLSSEENRKVYSNIPEYEKQDNICLVVNGELLTIPIPQETSALFGLPRAFVEKLYDGANTNSFWELATNSILGLSPIDLQGFLNIDSKNLYYDDEERFWDNMKTGFVKMTAQLMNPGMKTLVMLNTGKDPYTGKNINTAYEYYDQDTGETQVIDYYSSDFAKKVAGLFGQDVNAWMAQVILNNIMGKASSQVLEDLTSMANGVVPDAIAKDVTNVFTSDVYSKAQTAWSYTMKQLQDQKNSIVNSKEYQSAKDAVSFANGNDTKLRNGINKQKELLHPLYENTLKAVNALNEKYGAQFTSKKYGAVIALLNTADEIPAQTTSTYLSSEAQDLYYAGRNAAIETMANMGFKSPNDGSIFGYVKKNSSGDGYVYSFRDPVAILALDSLDNSQTNIHSANVEAALKAAGLTTKEMWNGYYNQTTKAGQKQYKSEWNSKVVEALEPYVKKYGVDMVVRNSTMVDILDNYIFVNNPYTAKTYIKSLFKED